MTGPRRASLVALMAVAAAAIGIAVAHWDAPGGKGASGPAWAAERGIRALPGQARGRLDERPPDRVEATPVLALPHHDAALLFGGADVLLLDSDLPPVQWLRGDLHWEPPPVPRIEKCPSWHFDLWHYKFPSGDLILNPEALDSIRPLE